jgi:hypothetical protein
LWRVPDATPSPLFRIRFYANVLSVPVDWDCSAHARHGLARGAGGLDALETCDD